jgi:2-iminoacetate synthase
MGFEEIIQKYKWDDVANEIDTITCNQVEQTLLKTSNFNIEDFKILISPAAENYVEMMAQKSNAITKKRFGNTVQLFAPMYLSNECQNICTYCGFSFDNKIERLTLNDVQINIEFQAIKDLGFDHILLVTGEANQYVGVSYLINAIRIAKKYFSNITIEVQPLEEEDYKLLIAEDLYAVLVYQETYHQENYKIYHPKGKKSNFSYRLQTPERLGNAKVHKIGLGVLLGLENWRVDSFFTGLHLTYLERKFWQTKFSVSFPRIRPNESCFEPNVHLTDKNLLQLICAYRIFNETVELSLSTRENIEFRNNAFKIGITTMSAGSKTEPGGYALASHALEQFTIDDSRTPQQVARMISQAGYEVVWKDWFKNIQHFN